jgi:hypothetical protein
MPEKLEEQGLFLPSLPNSYNDESFLTNIIENEFKLGVVKRIDFVQKPEKQSSYMAFVHFKQWHKTYDTDLFRFKIAHFGHVDVFGTKDYYGNRRDLPTNTNKRAFIRFLFNKTPIKEVELNIHQVSDNLERAEKQIAEQQVTITNLKTELENTNKKYKELEKRIRELESKENILNQAFIEEDDLSEVTLVSFKSLCIEDLLDDEQLAKYKIEMSYSTPVKNTNESVPMAPIKENYSEHIDETTLLNVKKNLFN